MKLRENGSYASNVEEMKITKLKEAIKELISNIKLEDNINIGLVDYGSNVKGIVDFKEYKDYNVLVNYIDKMSAYGENNIEEGLKKAYYMLRDKEDNSDNYIILITSENYSNDAVDKLLSHTNKNIKTFIIDYGRNINSNKLKYTTYNTNVKYFEAIDTMTMKNAYENIKSIILANLNADIFFQEDINKVSWSIDQEHLPCEIRLEQGKLIGNIGNIYYTLSDDKEYYEAKPIEFTIIYKPQKKGNFNLGSNYSSFVEYTFSDGYRVKKYFLNKLIEVH